MSPMQFLIAIDQIANVIAGGYADETLSARAYRCASTKPHWKKARKVIDRIFFWQPNHCAEAFRSEMMRRGLPPVYRPAP